MAVGVQFNSLSRIGDVHMPNDSFVGHVDALYDHVDILKATLTTLIPALGERSVAQTLQ
jgi:hypothetical protein